MHKITTSCCSIMPKFLWKHVIDILPAECLVKIIHVDRWLDSLICDTTWKHHFLNRTGDIALVIYRLDIMNYFWKYAYLNHTIYDSIDDLLNAITSDNKMEAQSDDPCLVYYKIFIKEGTYVFEPFCNNIYRFDYTKCCVKIIGPKRSQCIIRVPNVGYSDSIFFVISQYLSITNITFQNIGLVAECRSIYKNYYVSQLHISNCSFDDNAHLTIETIDNATVTNCTFSNTTLYIAGSIFGSSKTMIINYIIAFNTFIGSGINEFICMDSDYDKKSIVSITNNTLTCASILICNDTQFATIAINSNVISDIKTCIDTCELHSNKNSVILFENNIFNNVQSLFIGSVGTIKLEANNEFIDCGTDLIKHVT